VNIKLELLQTGIDDLNDKIQDLSKGILAI